MIRSEPVLAVWGCLVLTLPAIVSTLLIEAYVGISFGKTLAGAVQDAQKLLDRERLRRTRFALTGFLLVTESDQPLVSDLLEVIPELHHLTGKEILLIGAALNSPARRRRSQSSSPRALGRAGVYDVMTEYQLDRRLRTHETPTDRMLEKISEYKLLKKLSGEVFARSQARDLTPLEMRALWSFREIEAFFEAQTAETYNFAQLLGIRRSAIPCVALFRELGAWGDYVLWPLKAKEADALIQDFRELVDVVVQSRAEGKLDSILEQVEQLARSKTQKSLLSRLGELRRTTSPVLSDVKSLMAIGTAISGTVTFATRTDVLRVVQEIASHLK